jgi:hypothetical protein
LRFIETVRAVRGGALQVLQEGQPQIRRRLHAAFPGDLDEVEAAAQVRAFVGAVTVFQVLHVETVD